MKCSTTQWSAISLCVKNYHQYLQVCMKSTHFVNSVYGLLWVEQHLHHFDMYLVNGKIKDRKLLWERLNCTTLISQAVRFESMRFWSRNMKALCCGFVECFVSHLAIHFRAELFFFFLVFAYLLVIQKLLCWIVINKPVMPCCSIHHRTPMHYQACNFTLFCTMDLQIRSLQEDKNFRVRIIKAAIV